MHPRVMKRSVNANNPPSRRFTATLPGFRTVVDLALFAALTGCSDSSVDPPIEALPPSVLAVTLNDSVGPLLKRLSISLDIPGPVEVEYQAAASPRLRVVSPPDSLHDVLVARLIPDAVYDYSVRAVSPTGEYGEPVHGTFTTDSLPTDLAAIQVSASGMPTHQLTILEIRRDPAGGEQTFSGYVAIDPAGRVVWYWRSFGAPHGWDRRSNGNFVFVYNNRVLEVSPDLELISELPSGVLPEGAQPHHDLAVTTSGTVLFLAKDLRMINDTTFRGEAVWEWDPDRATVEKRWAAFDFFPTDVYRAPRSRTRNFYHANGLSIGPRGNLVMSFHFQNMVFSVTSDFQSVEWMLGGPTSTFGLDASAVFSGQHRPTELSDDRVLMFDNGADRPDDQKYSRALEVKLDLPSGRATHLWEFRATPDNYARGISSAERFANGNTLVAFGLPAASQGGIGGPIEVFEVTRERAVLWRVVVGGGVPSMYRATSVVDIAGEIIVPED